MIDLDNLLTVIRSTLTAASPLAGTAVFFDSAPAGQVRPYLAVSIADDMYEARVPQADIESVTIQIAAYATTLAQALRLAKAATELFDRQTIALSGQINLSGLRRFGRTNYAGHDSQGTVYCSLSQIALRIQVTF